MVRFALLMLSFFVVFANGDSNPSHTNAGMDPVATRAWLKRREEKREGVLISTSYRCRTSCRCAGRLLQKNETEYVVCADNSDEAVQSEAARAACKSSCTFGGKPEATLPECQPLNIQCKKAHCP